jgi:hypothetical protein
VVRVHPAVPANMLQLPYISLYNEIAFHCYPCGEAPGKRSKRFQNVCRLRSDGKTPRSGRGGRRFKSCHSDQGFRMVGIPLPTDMFEYGR